MGVLIKGMEMPKNCEKCLYSSWSNFYQIYVCNAVRKNEPVLFDGKQTKSTSCARSARADNCPLVPVPPHGRLIDADALVERIEGIWDCNDMIFEPDDHICNFPEDCKGYKWSQTKDCIERMVKNAPTIIPASEGE